jgi:hypothetical protein
MRTCRPVAVESHRTGCSVRLAVAALGWLLSAAFGVAAWLGDGWLVTRVQTVPDCEVLTQPDAQLGNLPSSTRHQVSGYDRIIGTHNIYEAT